MISGLISLKAIGVGCPEILADVETKGFFIRSNNLKQKGSFTIRTASELSAAMMFLATFLGSSNIRVVGFSDKSKITYVSLLPVSLLSIL